jgi:hypothetical protein
MQKLLSSLAIVALLTSAPAMAQTTDTTTPRTPRVNEIKQRIESQENKISNDVKEGKITAKQAVRDEKVDAEVKKQLSADQANHAGHITKAEQRHMNNELNKNSKRIHHQIKSSEERMEVVPVK